MLPMRSGHNGWQSPERLHRFGPDDFEGEARLFQSLVDGIDEFPHDGLDDAPSPVGRYTNLNDWQDIAGLLQEERGKPAALVAPADSGCATGSEDNSEDIPRDSCRNHLVGIWRCPLPARASLRRQIVEAFRGNNKFYHRTSTVVEFIGLKLDRTGVPFPEFLKEVFELHRVDQDTVKTICGHFLGCGTGNEKTRCVARVAYAELLDILTGVEGAKSLVEISLYVAAVAIYIVDEFERRSNEDTMEFDQLLSILTKNKTQKQVFEAIADAFWVFDSFDARKDILLEATEAENQDWNKSSNVGVARSKDHSEDALYDMMKRDFAKDMLDDYSPLYKYTSMLTECEVFTGCALRVRCQYYLKRKNKDKKARAKQLLGRVEEGTSGVEVVLDAGCRQSRRKARGTGDVVQGPTEKRARVMFADPLEEDCGQTQTTTTAATESISTISDEAEGLASGWVAEEFNPVLASGDDPVLASGDESGWMAEEFDPVLASGERDPKNAGGCDEGKVSVSVPVELEDLVCRMSRMFVRVTDESKVELQNSLLSVVSQIEEQL